MIFFLYNIAQWLGLCLTLPVWLVYLAMVPKARAGFWQKVGFYPVPAPAAASPHAHRPCVWFHAVSVGELNAIRPVIESVDAAMTVVISTTTRTAQKLARNRYPSHRVFYYPFDLWPAVNSALNRIQPNLVVLTETELWPNFLFACRRHRVPVVVVNGRISRGSFNGYRWIKWLLKPAFRAIVHFFMQTQADANRIQSLGDVPTERVTVAGNLKFDINPSLVPGLREQLAVLLGVDAQSTTLVYASTHPGEEDLLMRVYMLLRKDFPELRVILAPRHPERVPEVSKVLAMQNIRHSLRSKLQPDTPNTEAVVILDTIGELMAVYSLATVAVMGGSFVEKGGQNPLEPISQRIPVLFGPSMDNFPAITQLILDAGAGIQVKDTDELQQQLQEILTQPEPVYTMVESGQQLLENNRGAREIIVQGIRQWVTCTRKTLDDMAVPVRHEREP
ncbi:MAG: 3-deoxy-D-manno-octulosonic acid transferase [Candidatus Melainabacteria bacterium]